MTEPWGRRIVLSIVYTTPMTQYMIDEFVDDIWEKVPNVQNVTIKCDTLYSPPDGLKRE